MSVAVGQPAPELDVARWLNVEAPPSLGRLRGRVVVIEAFQMLCPGCVLHGLPQAQRIAAAFAPPQVAVLGLHCVFEHHGVQGSAEALAAFLHEYRIAFPVAIDRPTGGLPATMDAYGLHGTPTLLLIDADGVLRAHHFGSVADLQLGAEIGALLRRPARRDGVIGAALSAAR